LERPVADPSPSPGDAAHRLPARLRLAEAGAGELRFVGWSPLRAAVLLSPVWLVLSSLTWLAAPGASSGPRVLASLACLAVALGLIWGSRPRRSELRLLPAQRSLQLPDGSTHALSSAPRWLLTTHHPAESPRPLYLAVLVDGERRWPLLGSDDPAQLLRDLRIVLAHCPGEVSDEWALPIGAQPWSFRAGAGHPDSSRGAAPRSLRGFGAGRGLRWALGIATALVLVDLTVLVLSASAHVASVHPLSLVLPALAASWLVAIALAVATRHPRLVVGSQLVLEQRVLGLCYCSAQIPAASVRGAYLLAARGELQHLLVDSTDGPLALLLHVRDAESKRRELMQSLARPTEPRANESIASAPHRWQSG
jgi:hypothetical protein